MTAHISSVDIWLGAQHYGKVKIHNSHNSGTRIMQSPGNGRQLQFLSHFMARFLPRPKDYAANWHLHHEQSGALELGCVFPD